MTHYIADVPVASIQELDKSIGREIDELNIISEDSNILLNGNSEGEQLEIAFTLTKQNHPEELEVEEQRSELKELSSKEANQNYIQTGNIDGWISIEDVSIPESSDLNNIREGTISGIYLPYPKHFSKDFRGNDKRTVGFLELQLESEANVVVVSQFQIIGSLSFSLNTTPESTRAISLRPNKILSGSFGRDFGRVFGSGEIDEYTISGGFGYNFGRSFGGEEVEKIPALSFKLNSDGDINFAGLAADGNISYNISFLITYSGSFGDDFGSSFGGSEVDRRPDLEIEN